MKMTTKRIYCISTFVFALSFLLTNCQSNKKDESLSLKGITPVVIAKKGNEVFQYWEFANKPLTWMVNTAQVAELDSYKDSLETILGKNSFQSAVQKEAANNNPIDTMHSENGDLINARLVHSGSVGIIRPMNSLEAQLLNYQLARYPLLSHPTEFHGFILLHDSLNLIRVYFAASDQPWPPKPTVILESIKNDLKLGWNLKYHMHNHYEPKTNSYVGILAPSMADAQFFAFLSEDFSLGNALITNGFYTVEINRNEFSKFKAHHN